MSAKKFETAEENRKLVRRHFDAMNERNYDFVDEVYADNVQTDVERTGAKEPDVVGKQEFKKLFEEYESAFPDYEFEINELIAEGDKIVTLWEFTGTHEGEFRGLKPTGNKVDVSGYSFAKIKDGKIVETKAAMEMTSLLQQLGHEPPLQA